MLINNRPTTIAMNWGFFKVGQFVAKVSYLRLLFTSLTNSFAGLKAGIKCSGISTAIFFLIFRPIFAALFLVIKLPNPRM
jgi:hypothetical protein